MGKKQEPKTRDEELEILRRDFRNLLEEIKTFRDKATSANSARVTAELELERIQWELKKSRARELGLEKKNSALGGVIADLTIQVQSLNEELDEVKPGRKKTLPGGRKLRF